MSLVRGVISRALVLALGCMYGVIVLGRILLGMVKLGPGVVLSQKKRTSPPGCLQDERLGLHGYMYLENVKMHFVSSGGEDKPLMLLLHGFPEFWYSWRYQLTEFKDHYRVVAVDMRGYGETDKPSGIDSYTLPVLVEDIKQFITALGYSQCVLVGHDWGGAVAWALADQYPDLLSHLVILNCPDVRTFRKHLQSSLSQFKKSWYMFLFQLPYLPELLLRVNDFHTLGAMFKGRSMGVKSDFFTVEDLEAYKYNYSQNSFTGPMNYIRAGFTLASLSGVAKTDRESSEGITMPTLIVWGEKDGALDRPMAAMASQRCKGKVTVKYIEGASHWVQMDQPDLVNKHIREFLSQK